MAFEFIVFLLDSRKIHLKNYQELFYFFFFFFPTAIYFSILSSLTQLEILAQACSLVQAVQIRSKARMGNKCLSVSS